MDLVFHDGSHIYHTDVFFVVLGLLLLGNTVHGLSFVAGTSLHSLYYCTSKTWMTKLAVPISDATLPASTLAIVFQTLVKATLSHYTHVIIST